MNKYLLAAAFGVAICTTGIAQTVTVFQKNGERIKYNVSDVDKIVFEEEKPFDETNLLNEHYIPCEGFRDWINTHLGDGSGYYSLEQAAAYTGEIDLSRVETVTDITGIEYFTGLTVLKGEDAYFGNFNVGALKSLQYLQIVNTRITELDFTGLHDLQKAFISRNKISKLNLAQNPNLQKLWCDCNELTNIDLTGCTGLRELVCSYNQLNSLILPECPLEILSAHQNLIYNINLSNVAKTLDTVSLFECGLSSLDCTGASKMTYLDCGGNPLLTPPVLTGCKRLETLRMENVESKDFGDMDFSDCTKLSVLRLDFSKIGKAIDLTKNKQLYELSLEGCGLEDINVEGLINLGYVNVTKNNFKRLDLSSADGLFSVFAHLNSVPAEIKVWPEFNLNTDPASQGFYIDDKITLVHEFSN